MAAVRVQSVSNGSTTTSIAVTATQGWVAPTVGNLLVGWYGGDNTCTTPTGWTAGPSVVDNDAVYFWWKVAAAGDSAGVTFTQAGASPGQAGLIEYSGVTTPHETPGGSATVNALTSGTTGGTVTQAGTGASGDLFVSLANAHDWASTTAPTSPTWSNSFVNFVSLPTISGTSNLTASATFVADFQNAAAATVTTACTWTNAAIERSGLIIAFKLTAGAAPAAPPPGILFIGPTRG